MLVAASVGVRGTAHSHLPIYLQIFVGNKHRELVLHKAEPDVIRRVDDKDHPCAQQNGGR